MHNELPDIGTVSTVTIDGLEIRYARSGADNGMPPITRRWS